MWWRCALYILLILVTRCIETIDVSFYVSCIDRVGSVGVFIVKRPLFKIVIYSIGQLKYGVCWCKGCDGCCVFC